MRRFRTMMTVVAAGLCLGLAAAACSRGGGGGSGGFDGTGLTGAGATFPQPIYMKWFADFRKVESGAKVNYQAIGSGGGVEQFTAQTVDFGASDAPLKDEEEQALPAPALEIPTVLGGVVISYNVSGVDTGLKLDGPTAADIFLGKVKTWNDAEIADQNPDLTLPATPILVAHRSDESGTTKVFTSWLSAESPEWEQKVGADKAVQWPVGTGGDGNDGVAAQIGQNDGSIGYVSFDFALANSLGYADIKRDDGTYVTPSVDSISAAGGGLSIPITADTNILNSDASGAYPISSTTYLLVYKDLTSLGKDKARTLVDLLHWCLTDGQSETKDLYYSPLPDQVYQQAVALLGGITYQNKPLKASAGIG